MRRESRRLSVVLGSISDGVIVAGLDGRISLGNAAAGRLLGVEPGRLAGRSLEEVLPGVTVLVREANVAALTGIERLPVLRARPSPTGSAPAAGTWRSPSPLWRTAREPPAPGCWPSAT